MVQGMPWIKLYSEILDDPKVGTLSGNQFSDFVKLLLVAGETESRNGDLPYTDERLAWRLRRPLDELMESIEALIREGILCRNGDGLLSFVNFEKRQYGPPSATPKRVRERVTRHRDKEGEKESDDETEVKQLRNEPVTTLKQGCNEVVTTPDIEKDIDQEKDPEGAAVAARPPPKTRKSRKKIPKSAAVEYYRSCTNRYPNRVQIRDIDAAVTNLTQLNVWKQSVDLWMRKGWNPQNIDGMLEVFKNGGRSKYGRGQDNATDEPRPIPGYELADLDEVRRCQEEQWAKERAALPDVQGGGGGPRPPPGGR